jgi:hypothetical protein
MPLKSLGQEHALPLPENIQCDHGKEFTTLLTQFLAENNVCQISKAPYNKNYNGLAEVSIKLLNLSNRPKKLEQKFAPSTYFNKSMFSQRPD